VEGFYFVIYIFSGIESPNGTAV